MSKYKTVSNGFDFMAYYFYCNISADNKTVQKNKQCRVNLFIVSFMLLLESEYQFV